MPLMPGSKCMKLNKIEHLEFFIGNFHHSSEIQIQKKKLTRKIQFYSWKYKLCTPKIYKRKTNIPIVKI